MSRLIEIETYLIRDSEEIKVTVSAYYSPGCDAVSYLKNGDPGYPAEPPSIDDLKVVDDDGKDWELTEKEEEAIYLKIEESVSEGYFDED